jgi:hypothetical protein
MTPIDPKHPLIAVALAAANDLSPDQLAELLADTQDPATRDLLEALRLLQERAGETDHPLGVGVVISPPQLAGAATPENLARVFHAKDAYKRGERDVQFVIGGVKGPTARVTLPALAVKKKRRRRQGTPGRKWKLTLARYLDDVRKHPDDTSKQRAKRLRVSVDTVRRRCREKWAAERARREKKQAR